MGMDRHRARERLGFCVWLMASGSHRMSHPWSLLGLHGWRYLRLWCRGHHGHRLGAESTRYEDQNISLYRPLYFYPSRATGLRRPAERRRRVGQTPIFPQTHLFKDTDKRHGRTYTVRRSTPTAPTHPRAHTCTAPRRPAPHTSRSHTAICPVTGWVTRVELNIRKSSSLP